MLIPESFWPGFESAIAYKTLNFYKKNSDFENGHSVSTVEIN